jgi:hypothetical protein
MARSQLTQNGHVASLIASVLRRLAELAICDRHASWLAFRIGFVEQPDRRNAIALQSGEPSAQCRPPPTWGIPGQLVELAPRVVESLLIQQLRGQLEALVVDLVLRGNTCGGPVKPTYCCSRPNRGAPVSWNIRSVGLMLIPLSDFMLLSVRSRPSASNAKTWSEYSSAIALADLCGSDAKGSVTPERRRVRMTEEYVIVPSPSTWPI